MREWYLTIGGRRVAGATRVPVIDPAHETVFADAPVADADQIDAAITAAAEAFPAWRAVSWDDRRDRLERFANALESRAAEIGEVLMHEQGKPLQKAIGEVRGSVAFVRSLAALRLETQELRRDRNGWIMLQRDPLGVVVCITAWNFPLMLAVWKIVPALLTGNTVVLKPSPKTPLSTLMLGEVAREILPPGVINVVNCTDEHASLLSSHPLVRKISFTGSTRTGQRIMAAAAEAGLKRVTLELGGNDAAIVLDDVDVDEVASGLFWAKFNNSGQVCAAAKRIIVHETIHDRFCDALVTVAKEVTVGPGSDARSALGPVQNRQQVDVLEAMLADAVARGSTVLYQGDRPAGAGTYFPVTILTNVPLDALVVREEAFGPLLPILQFSGDEAALHMANDSAYGLGGSVWSANGERAAALACRLDVGTAWVNQHPAIAPDVPFGGAKASGIGVEFSEIGLAEFTQLKVVSVKAG